MEYSIRGTTMPLLEVSMGAGDALFTQAGGMAWFRGPIDMQASTRGGALKALARMVGGESLFLTTYRASGPAQITFAPRTIGAVVPVNLAAGQSLIATKDAFLCAEDSVSLEIVFRAKVMAGLLGGPGFILQRVSGPGQVFLELSGEVTALELAAGETLTVDGAHIGFFEPTVTHDVKMLRGLKNILGSGEGLALDTLTGPGKVWLRSLPLRNLAQELAAYMPRTGAGSG
ncbi:MAG TPA: TIGR00266 family protein [Armatimonadetes bacterium]|nr:TIGR00266 family protein [Armatimonadota bacterium]